MIGRGFWAIALSVFCLSSAARAQDSVEELRKTVEQLQQQLDAIQQKLNAIEQQQAQPAPTPPQTSAAAPSAPAAPRPGELEMYWQNGIHIDSAPNAAGEKPFQLRLLGTIQNDWGWFWTNDDLETVAIAEDGTEFRRARLGIGGTIYTNYDFLAVYDFAEGQAEFKDVYMSAKNIPGIGSIRVGHFTEYASLDLLTSDNDTVFLERALTGVLVPARNVGVGVQNAFFDSRMTAAAGVFRNSDDFGFGSGDENYAFTTRVTGLPWRAEDGAHYIHLGAWTSVRGDDIENYRIRQRPEAHLAEYFIDTFDEIGAVSSEWLYGAEAAIVFGSFSAQGEFMQHRLDREDADTATMQGGYLTARYLLTGEHRTYRPTTGVFDRVVPDRNFQIGKGGGPGAWEVAVRYSHLDLQDQDVSGGTQDDITAGLNWYINPSMKIMLNYIHAWVDRDATLTFEDVVYPPIDGSFDGLLTRFQVNW